MARRPITTAAWLLALVSAAPLMPASQARAAIVSGSFSGTIAGNTKDTYGLFGTTGADLSGDTISATYNYDTSLASYYILQPNFDAWLGTGGLTLSVTIGGNTVATTGVTNTEIIDTQDGADTEVTLANLAPAPLIDFTLFVQGTWLPGVTIETPFLLDPTYLRQTIYVSADGNHYDQLYFAGSSAPAAAAPEPTSLALLCAGLTGIGCVRRRRSGAARSASPRR